MTHPYATVTSIRPVVRDGWYNAWTDLIWWKEYFWLAHFRGLSHGIVRSTKGAIAGNTFSVILRSADLRRWHEAQVFEPPGGIVDGNGVDTAHLCASDDRLYAFFREMSHGADDAMNHHSYVSWTEDGVRWSEPEALTVGGDFRPYTWRVRWYDGRFFCALNYLAEGHPIDLIVSDDGVHWSRHAEIAAPGHDCSEESELHLRPDGELWCVIRTTGAAAMFVSLPPYTEWKETQRLPAGCDAPVMCESGGHVYLAGRCAHSAQGVPGADGSMPFALQNTFDHVERPGVRSGTTGLYRLTRDRADLLVLMPPAYDSSYPGLVSLEPGKLIMSYYSDVGYVSGEVPLKNFPEFRFKESECDIYVAEIDVGEMDAL
jgi:hypothetical protein